MADNESPSIAAYREYANRGILAVSTINSGAILAALANIESLRGLDGVTVAFQAWTVGLAAATACWLFAYRANAAYARAHETCDRLFSALGLLSFVLSLASFIWGSWAISAAFNAEAETVANLSERSADE
ncbi:hypothetical protein [Sulfitobacter sp. W074]|uniref:hypothetical protein n=1 Tax=Sulfitobacter sp. W074 TaxID=2867026 RepID=UPI0021A75AE9|nr:hypothetical protein [Sulfitobacter sp. W074]UWR36129.1 hypothetical protein K3762_09930 [Sulfitobacter sp. W074]